MNIVALHRESSGLLLENAWPVSFMSRLLLVSVRVHRQVHQRRTGAKQLAQSQAVTVLSESHSL